MNNTIEKRPLFPSKKALYFSHNFCTGSLAERTSDLLTKHSSSSPFLVALKVFLLPLVWVPPKLYIPSAVNTKKELHTVVVWLLSRIGGRFKSYHTLMNFLESL